jgi:hypothetical protein
MKQYRREQDQIASMKEHIAHFGHGSAKLARQAQRKEKVLAKRFHLVSSSSISPPSPCDGDVVILPRLQTVR